MNPHLLVSALLCCVTGCGTMANLDGHEFCFLGVPAQRKPSYFGGVRNDVRCVGHNLRWMVFNEVPAVEIPFRLVGCGVATADIPASVIADTATLRIVARQRKEWGEPIPVHFQTREALAGSLWLSRDSFDRIADEFDCPRVSVTHDDGKEVTYYDSRFMTDWDNNRRKPHWAKSDFWASRLDDPAK